VVKRSEGEDEQKLKECKMHVQSSKE